MNRINTVKVILWSILGVGASVALWRFLLGLGTTTALNDANPWGLWIGFDVLGGVALAAGGFVITATVYVLNREDLHHLARPAVLTAFLGYIAVAVGLMFDLGLPWNIWHPTIYWNPNSALFEVAWCVMLYLTILGLEFLPVPLESTSRFAAIRRFLVKYRMLIVAAGIMLSTLHQSSLGTLFLAMPFRLHGLWYSQLLPILFFVSAIGLGLMMICFESLATSYLYRRKYETGLLNKLAKAAVWVLAIYLVVRLGDIAVSGKFGLIFEGTWESTLFIAEIIISVVIPVVVFASPRLRNLPGPLFAACTIGVLGFVANRLNVGGITMLRAVDAGYFPSWTEFVISASVVSGAALVFFFAVERFNVWDARPADPEAEPERPVKWRPGAGTWLGTPGIAGLKKNSLAFTLACAVGFAMLPGGEARSTGVETVATQQARGGDVLRIDGNSDGFLVLFDHEIHKKKMGGPDSCKVCHHARFPHDKDTGCYRCHTDMYLPVSIFNHDSHVAYLGGNQACDDCHPSESNRGKEGTKDCAECHKDDLSLLVPDAPIPMKKWVAPGYTDAMHGLCISCHKEIAGRIGNSEHGSCLTCHLTDIVAGKEGEWTRRQAVFSNKWVITTRLLSPKVKLDRFLVDK